MYSELLLDGIRVLDLTRVLAGPLCTQTLGDLGAEVIKVEQPGRGDDTRDWGIKDAGKETPYFNSFNRNKKSITLDLKAAEDLAQLLQLVADCDVLVHNFKGGDAERMGIDFESIKAIKSDIIYCHIAGYDQHGEEKYRPGYDLVVQGETGLMSINGEKGTPPLKFGVAVVDLYTGMSAAQLILAALVKKHKDPSAKKLELALFDCGLMVSCYYGLEALQMNKEPEKYGNAHPSIVPYGVFEVLDGKLVITVGNNLQFEKFCSHVIARADLLENPKFNTNLNRNQNRVELLATVRAELLQLSKRTLLERMAKVGIPCGEVLGVLEAIQSERVQKAGLVTELPNQQQHMVKTFTPPFRVNGQRLGVRDVPPALGEHNAMLQSLAPETAHT